MLTYFKICLNESSEKQRTFIQVCSGNMDSFLLKYTFLALMDVLQLWLQDLISKGYRPEARGYVIYSPRALPEGAARVQHTRGMNHITTS